MLINYYYEKLSPQEQYVYRAVKNALLRGEANCPITDLNKTEAEKVVKAVTMDCPEIIHYPGLFITPQGSGRNMSVSFQCFQVDRETYDRRLNQLVEAIEKTLPSAASDYVKCKAIFDALATRVRNNPSVASEYIRLQNTNPSSQVLSEFIAQRSNNFSPYGVLMNYKGVHQGIAKLFKILCDRFALPCACVEAVSNNADRVPHMLNVVEIDGKRAFVDVTNGLKLKDMPVILYDYFLVSGRLYATAYIVSEEFNCVAEDVNYFVKNKVWFTSVQEMRKYLCAYTAPSRDGVVRCRYDGNRLDHEELKKLFDEILSMHCKSGCRVTSIVRHGFCTGLTNIS